jgi:hypothetical protein
LQGNDGQQRYMSKPIDVVSMGAGPGTLAIHRHFCCPSTACAPPR